MTELSSSLAVLVPFVVLVLVLGLGFAGCLVTHRAGVAPPAPHTLSVRWSEGFVSSAQLHLVATNLGADLAVLLPTHFTVTPELTDRVGRYSGAFGAWLRQAGTEGELSLTVVPHRTPSPDVLRAEARAVLADGTQVPPPPGFAEPAMELVASTETQTSWWVTAAPSRLEARGEPPGTVFKIQLALVGAVQPRIAAVTYKITVGGDAASTDVRMITPVAGPQPFVPPQSTEWSFRARFEATIEEDPAQGENRFILFVDAPSATSPWPRPGDWVVHCTVEYFDPDLLATQPAEHRFAVPPPADAAGVVPDQLTRRWKFQQSNGSFTVEAIND